MAKIKDKVSIAPTGTEATNAEGNAETNAVAVVNDAAATRLGFSVPSGTHTASESGAVAGSAPADLVKPLGEEPTKGIMPEAATPSMPGITPAAEAAASGDNSTNASQGAAETGAGNPAGSGEPPTVFGIDLANGPDFGAISLGDKITVLSDRYPLSYAFFAKWDDGDPDTMPTGLRVISKTDGFRRAGVAHSASGLTLLPGEFTPDQLEAWLGEPELTVELV